MKAVTIFAAMVFFAAPAMQAQNADYNKYFSDSSVYKTANIPAALKAFESCLTTDNTGVQESAIAHLTMLKLMLPAVEAAKISRELEMLSTSAPQPSTRFKAYIASQVYKNPELFATAKNADYSNGNELFNALASRMQSSLISYNGQ